MKNFLKIIYLVLVCVVVLQLNGCFTGVEGTKKITLSKKELSSVAPTDEELYLESVAYPPVGEWEKGKRFEVTDEKLNVMLSFTGNIDLKKGDIIEYVGIEERVSPDGHNKSDLIFSSGNQTFRLPVEKTYSETLREYYSSQLPMIIDLSVIDNLRRRLVGKKFWTRTPLWYDSDMKYKTGRKFVPIEITAVEAGDTFFPAKIKFKDNLGETSYLMMNIGSGGNETRSFAKLFLLSDPRKQNKGISEQNWEAIQKGEVKLGMTKEECRLSLGNPTDTNVGHDYSRTLEIWNYPDGTYVHFVDDIVVKFRQR